MKCNLCGGNAGQLNEAGAHNLCAARANLHLPTPNLGTRCPVCDGRKTLGKGGVPLFFSLGPAKIKQSIEAQFPPCPACRGNGIAPAREGGR
jgi:hypothetical protein